MWIPYQALLYVLVHHCACRLDILPGLCVALHAWCAHVLWPHACTRAMTRHKVWSYYYDYLRLTEYSCKFQIIPNILVSVQHRSRSSVNVCVCVCVCETIMINLPASHSGLYNSVQNVTIIISLSAWSPIYDILCMHTSHASTKCYLSTAGQIYRVIFWRDIQWTSSLSVV